MIETFASTAVFKFMEHPNRVRNERRSFPLHAVADSAGRSELLDGVQRWRQNN